MSEKGFMVIECLSAQHYSIYHLSITIFLNKCTECTAQVLLYACRVAENLGKLLFFFFFLKIGNPPAISQNGGSFKNIQQEVSEQCYITQLILTCFF